MRRRIIEQPAEETSTVSRETVEHEHEEDLPQKPEKKTMTSTEPLKSSVRVPSDQAEGEITVTWGKELFSPKQFHTYEAGPFSMTTRVRIGETFAQAAERAMEDLRLFAEKERERKKQSYLKALAG